MATLIIPAVTGVAVGSGWWYVAIAAGMYIDQSYTYPTLFGSDPVEGPRLEDQPVARWSEGTPIPRVFGANGRVPGQVIWQSPIKEIREEESGGGKGGGGGTFVTYKYFSNCAVAFCAGPVSRIKQIWADGKTVYNVAPDIDYTSTQIAGAISSSTLYAGSTIYWLTLTSSGSGSPDLSLFKSGKSIEITAPGDPGTDHPYSLTVESVNTNLLTGVTTCKCRLGPAGHGWTAWAAGGTVTLHQDLPTFSKKHFNAVRFHVGAADQQPDSLLETYHGIGEVPAFRNTAYVVFEQLALFDWGNRIPSFSALIEEDEGRKVHEAMESILIEGDMAPGEFDLSDIEAADKSLAGYVIPGPQETTTSLQPLALQTDFLAQQRDSAIRFFRRSQARIVDIDSADLACYETNPGDTPISVIETPTSQLPDEVNVKYIDANNEYNTGSQRQRRVDNETSVAQTIQLPVVMETAEARAIASKMLWTAWAARLQVKFSIPAIKYADKLLEGDIARFTALGEEWTVLVTKLDRGHNLIMEVEGQVEDQNTVAGYSAGEEALSMTAGGEDDGSYMTQGPSFHTPNTRTVWWECRALKEKHATIPGFYLACCSEDPNYEFTGAALYESLNGESGEYVKVAEINGGSTIGECTSYTGATAYHGQWDRANTIRVELLNGSLSSCTELELLNGMNRAVFGDEIIGFQTATLVADNTYDLTDLLRGLRGTEAKIGDATHGARDQFALLGTSNIHFHEIPSGAIGSTRHYKAVPAGRYVEEVTAWSLTIGALTVKPLPPVVLSRTIDGSSNATVTWGSRSRGLSRILGTGAVPSYERKDEYKVELIHKTSGAVSTTYTATEAKTQAITASAQSTGGYTAGVNPLTVRVSQFSEYHRFGDTSTTTV